MKVLILLAVVVSTSAFEFSEEWSDWKALYGKQYDSELLEIRRYTIWMANKKFIDEHNAQAELFGYTVGVNELSDLESSEINSLYNGYREPATPDNDTKVFLASPSAKAPSSVDWRTKGVVTGVKNQGNYCGSCWSFSATGALEGQHAIKTRRLASCSEQQLMDCSGSYGNNGCHGGNPINAFRYLIANGGDDSESSYPYQAAVKNCRFKRSSVAATMRSYRLLAKYDENTLKQATATIGPISVAIDASHRSFHSYRRGIYYEPACSSSHLDHAVLVVGYGSSGGQDYWIVKNSWGRGWGMDGYIWMARNRNNNCGIATAATYPVV